MGPEVMGPEEIGSLLIRIALALLVFDGVWGSCRDVASRHGVAADAALLFKWQPKLVAFAGLALAAAGAVSILLGIFPRLGALALTVFFVPAAMIHFAKQMQATKLERQIMPAVRSDSAARDALAALTASAKLGNYTAGLKNLSLLGATLYLLVAGARPPMLIGFGADWQLHGLLLLL